MAGLRDEEQRKSIELLKNTAEAVSMERAQYDYDTSDVIMDVLACVAAFAVGFGWLFLILLIISFVTLGVLKFNIGVMLAVSIVFGLVMGIWRITKTVNKYKGKRIRKYRQNRGA